MVEHRVAGSWLGATCIALGVEMDIFGGSTDWHQSSGAESPNGGPPDDILVREGGAEWLPGHWGRTRYLSLNQPLVGRSGTGTAARGVPRTRGPRVVGGECPGHRHLGAGRPFPSGSGKTKRPVSGSIGEGPSPPGDAGKVPLAVISLLGLLALGRLCL